MLLCVWGNGGACLLLVCCGGLVGCVAFTASTTLEKGGFVFVESKLRLCPSREAVIHTLSPELHRSHAPGGGGIFRGGGGEVLPLEGIGAKLVVEE